MKKMLAGVALLLSCSCAMATVLKEFRGDDFVRDDKRYERTVDGGVFRSANKTASRYCEIALKLDWKYRPDAVLAFEYRVAKGDIAKMAYVAIGFDGPDKRSTFDRLPVSGEWKKAELPLGKLTFSKERVEPGTLFRQLRLYSRLNNTAEPELATFEVRNVKLTADLDYDPLADVRLSYSARVLFDWPELPGATSYRFEYAADPSFPAASTQRMDTKYPFFVPGAPFAPGSVISYRVFALPMEKVIASDRARIADPAQSWKLPEIDFAAVAAAPHPRLLAMARFQNPDVDSLTRQAELLLKFAVPPNPEPFREGADPAISARIVWLGKIANGVITATGRKLQTVGLAAMLTGRNDLRAKAKELSLGIARTWDPESGSHARYADLSASNLLLGLGFCYDAAYDLFTPDERAAVAACIRAYGQQFWEMTFPFRGNEAQNHPWDQAQAAAFAAVVLAEEPASELRFRFVASLYAYRFLPSLGFDGENNEGLAYWSFGFGLAVRYLELAKYAVGVDYFTQPWLRQTVRFPLYCAPAEGELVSFADSGRPNHGAIKGPMNRRFIAKLAVASNDGAALFHAGIPEQGGVKAVLPIDIPQSKFYPHIGWSVFNTFLPDGRENVALGFHAGKYFAGHQHADQNSFVINAYGDRLAIDGGYYDWWGSKHFHAYSTRTIAHNTVLVNGKEQAIRVFGADAKTTGFFDSPGFGYVAGDASSPKLYGAELTKFDRQLVFVKPNFVFCFDQLAAPKPSTFSWLFHSHSEKAIAFDPATQIFSFDRPQAGLTGTLLLPEKIAATVERSYTEMPVQGYSVELDPHPQTEWTLAAANAAPAAEADFLAAMQVWRAGSSAAPVRWEKLTSDTAYGIRGADTLVIFNRGKGRAKLPGCETDARAAALRFAPDGKVADAMFSGGTFLTYGNERWTNEGAFAKVTERKISREENAQLLSFDGKAVKAELCTVEMLDGNRIYTLSGVIDIPASGMLTLHANRAKLPLNLILGNDAFRRAAVIKPGENAAPALKVEPGKTLFSLVSAEPLTVMRLESGSGGQLGCRQLPPDFQPPAGAVKIEAENPVSTSRASSVLEFENASGNRVQQGWNSEGRISEWEFKVPESGKYRLLIRAAADVEPILYEMRLDGQVPAKDFSGIRLDSTGGQGFAAADFRYSEVPVDFELKSGIHRLQLTVQSGAVNLDCFVLVKQ